MIQVLLSLAFPASMPEPAIFHSSWQEIELPVARGRSIWATSQNEFLIAPYSNDYKNSLLVNFNDRSTRTFDMPQGTYLVGVERRGVPIYFRPQAFWRPGILDDWSDSRNDMGFPLIEHGVRLTVILDDRITIDGSRAIRISGLSPTISPDGKTLALCDTTESGVSTVTLVDTSRAKIKKCIKIKDKRGNKIEAAFDEAVFITDDTIALLVEPGSMSESELKLLPKLRKGICGADEQECALCVVNLRSGVARPVALVTVEQGGPEGRSSFPGDRLIAASRTYLAILSKDAVHYVAVCSK